MPLGLVHFDPASFPPEAMPCLRCGAETMLRFAGPCPACAAELRAKFQGSRAAVEGGDYVPEDERDAQRGCAEGRLTCRR